VSPVWSYTDPSLFSNIMSSVQRLPNGNTLICSAQQGWIFEVTPAGQRIWEHRGSGQIWLAEPVQRTLWANKKEVSATSGGAVVFDLLSGSPAANDLYLLLCSGSGTSPGTPVFGTTLPLNYDPFFLVSSLYPNSPPIFVNTFGILGPAGDASAAFTLPAGAAPGGFRLDFAYLRIRFSPLSFAAGGNAVPLLAR
jgi:hypothetical protein